MSKFYNNIKFISNLKKIQQMELQVWKEDFNLPSLSPECIQVILFVKLSKAPVLIKPSKNPYFSFRNKYPIFKDGSIILTNVTDILNYLREKNHGIDFGLNAKNCSESYAFINMLNSKLKPIIEFVFWGDLKNYEELSSPWFIKHMPPPFNYIYPKQRRNYANNLLETLYPNIENQEVLQSYIKSMAVECFSILATRLGKKTYFFGNSPTSLDVFVYSYLALLVKIPFPSREISVLLSTWPELIEFVKRIDMNFFPKMYSNEINANVKITSECDQGETSGIKTKIFAFLACSVAMLGYAFSKNIINTEKIRNAFVTIN